MRVSTTFASASSSSQPPSAGLGWAIQKATRAASARGAKTTKSICGSVPERGELLRVERGELAVDVEDHDPHHEHGGEEVEEDARLHHGRHEVGEEEPEHEHAVLEDEEADDLRHRLAPRDDEEEARPHRGEAGRDEVGVLAGDGERHGAR